MVFYLWKENKRAAIEHFNGHWAIQYNLGHHFVVLDYPPILVHNIFIWIFHRFKDENGRRSRHFSWNSRYHHALHVPVYMCSGFTYTVLDFWSPPLPSFLYPSTLRSPSLAAALDPPSPAHSILPFVREIMILCVLLFLYEICMRERNHVWYIYIIL